MGDHGIRSVVVLVAVALGASAGCTGAEPALAPPPTVTVTPRPVVPVPSSVQRIPGQPPVVHHGTVDDARIGVAYEYHLYVHCGIRAARFAGRWWLAVTPTDGATVPNDGSQYVTDSMTLVTPALARFEWGGRSAEFAPAVVEPQPCA